MDVLTGKLVSNPSVYQIPCGDTGVGSLRASSLSGWRLGAHRFDIAWINSVPSSPGDVTINQDFLYSPGFINRAVITPDGLLIDGKLAVVEVQGRLARLMAIAVREYFSYHPRSPSINRELF